MLPWLYIGNAYHAAQQDRLRALGISALLNVAEAASAEGCVGGTPEPPGRTPCGVGGPAEGAGPAHAGRGRVKEASSTFCHMSIPIVDSATADISGKFPDAIDFIGMVMSRGYCPFAPIDPTQVCKRSMFNTDSILELL